MKKWKIFLAAVIAMCLFTGCSNKIKEGTKLMEEKKYEDSIDVFQEAIEKGKQLGEAYLGTGVSYFKLKNYPAAKQALKDALKNGIEETPIIYNMMGVCDMEQGNIDTARESFEKGITLPTDEKEYRQVIQEMRYNVIVCYEKQADWKNAKDKMKEYISKYPDDESAQ